MFSRKFIALSFGSEEDFGKCLDILYEEEFYFELPGDMDIIIPTSILSDVKRKLEYIVVKDFNEVEVVSSSELPPEDIATLRKKQFLSGNPIT